MPRCWRDLPRYVLSGRATKVVAAADCRLCYRCCRDSQAVASGRPESAGASAILAAGGHLNDLELSDLLSGLFLNAGSLRSGTGGAHCGSGSHQPGQQMRSAAGSTSTRAGSSAGAPAEPAEVPSRAAVPESSKNAGRAGSSGSLRPALLRFFNGLGAVQGEGLCDHRTLRSSAARNFLSRLLPQRPASSERWRDGCQGGFISSPRLIRVLGGYLRFTSAADSSAFC